LRTCGSGDYPSRPIRLIVPYPAGGFNRHHGACAAGADGEDLGQPLVIDNRGGAAGTTGANEAARAESDGLHAVVCENTVPISIAPLLQKGVDFEPLKSFAPVSLVSKAPLVWSQAKKVAVNDVAGPDRLRKGQSKPMLYATGRTGFARTLSTERFLNQAGYRWSTSRIVVRRRRRSRSSLARSTFCSQLRPIR